MKVPCKNIPTYDCNIDKWTTTSFENQKEFGDFLMKECFKEPGEYDFDETIFKLEEFKRKFKKEKTYCNYTKDTEDYFEFWDSEELKSRLGTLLKRKDGKWFYFTKDYYFLINYCTITNKEEDNEEGFMSIRDGQYHMMLYEKIAEIYHMHSVILKKRQFAFSNCHSAKAINMFWFENRKTIKILASDDKYLNGTNGCWKMIEGYINHLNTHTGWKRGLNPSTYPSIKQVEAVKFAKTGKWQTEGNESNITCITLKNDPTAAVGGTGSWYWHEEGGIAPKADKTLIYVNPALSNGSNKSGSFCIGGSVGDLDDCGPLKNFMYKPETYDFFAVPNKWYDDTGVVKITGLFIPVQYSYPQAVDEFGNSLVEKALELIKIQDAKDKLLPPEDYILTRSQNPKTMKEAFDYRKVNEFDVQKIERRQKTIELLKEEKKFHVTQGLLELTKDGINIRLKELSEFNINKPFEMEYPVKMTEEDKKGIVNIYEEYNSKFTYYAGVDSVESDITTTSPSLFSIHIYRRGYTELDTTTGKKKTVKGKIVADWCGRFDSIDATNDHGLLLLKMYKAKAACEKNRPNFINHCRRTGNSHLIARKSELPFNKDVSVNLNILALEKEEYGVHNDGQGSLLRDLKRVMKEYLNAEHDTITITDKDNLETKVVKVIRGYDSMDGYWTLEELKLYNKDDNFDRFISAALAIAYGVAEELSFEKKVEIESTQENRYREAFYKPQRSYLPTSRQFNQTKQKRRSLLTY